MNKKEIDKLTDLYDTLIENGVRFYYGSEIISTGEISSIEFNEDDTIEVEINGFENYEVDIDDFAENHSKEGVNYHCWETVRKFDSILVKGID